MLNRGSLGILRHLEPAHRSIEGQKLRGVSTLGIAARYGLSGLTCGHGSWDLALSSAVLASCLVGGLQALLETLAGGCPDLVRAGLVRHGRRSGSVVMGLRLAARVEVVVGVKLIPPRRSLCALGLLSLALGRPGLRRL